MTVSRLPQASVTQILGRIDLSSSNLSERSLFGPEITFLTTFVVEHRREAPVALFSLDGPVSLDDPRTLRQFYAMVDTDDILLAIKGFADHHAEADEDPQQNRQQSAAESVGHGETASSKSLGDTRAVAVGPTVGVGDEGLRNISKNLVNHVKKRKPPKQSAAESAGDNLRHLATALTGGVV